MGPPRWLLMEKPLIIVMEPDVMLRHPVSEYLRECGYRVLEAVSATEVRDVLSVRDVSLVLASAGEEASDEFQLSNWMRLHHPHIEVVLAGTIDATVRKAGDLCENRPFVAKPYDHQLVADRIKRLIAGRKLVPATG